MTKIHLRKNRTPVKAKVIKIISEHKNVPRDQRPAPGMKRVMAVVEINGKLETKHIDVPR
jgi:hypothetical protein